MQNTLGPSGPHASGSKLHLDPGLVLRMARVSGLKYFLKLSRV